ncbi:hypothetical protein N7447_010130 [Penicillium robsamsonii]|uniref:uncharacterized protein n=1 Tax=Penicillium robsamsonii TaxID=1792511 RepID=UPI0025472D86|nr:uncharacterized protein N7447_010130 [Penicillium robsamsonii]KAJ5813107.1 hypothetical protein N7447_010130 [Penicillium robsamsonii]
MASSQPTLLEYARFYNIAEESTRYCPSNYADDTCEPTIPTPPVEGLNPEHPEDRLKEIDRRFCAELMMERLPTKPEDMELLSGCLQLRPFNRNIWRGILPEVTPSELNCEPLLLTTQDERMFASSEFHTNFAQSPTLSSPSPSVHLLVPSGPDVPAVPINTRDVFDLYNSAMASQSNTLECFTIPGNVTAESSNMTTTSHLAGDALPPIVGPSGTVHQFVSIESDPVPSVSSQGSGAYAPSAISSEHPTESEFSPFVFYNTTSPPPLSDVSLYNKSQPTFSIVSPNLTKEKGFSVGGVDSQKTQAYTDLKGEKGTKALLGPVAADAGMNCEQKGIVPGSLSTICEDTLAVSNSVCSSSSITRSANHQNITQLARAQNANDSHVSFKTSSEQNPNIMATHTSSVDRRHSCAAQAEQFRMKLGYKPQKVPFKPPGDNSSKDYTTSGSSKPVFGGLGSLCLFMQTRGSDGGYVTSSHDPSSHDPSSLSLSGSTRSGQGEFSNASPGDRPRDYDKDPSDAYGLPGPAISMQEMVTRSAFNPPPMFFLSTTLLRTHLSVIRDMEGWPGNPPKLIYREYGDDHCDAEVILAPDTGLILTTLHELTQRYLPGHGPKDERLNGIRGINSPLREKIFRLMHRYALLVVLICEPDNADVSSGAFFSSIRDIGSLAGFCDSQNELSKTLLVPIPNHSTSIVLWCFGMGRLRYELFPSEVIGNIIEGESEYEVALRNLGINPFAGRLILDNIRVSGFNQFPGFDLYPLPLPSHVANASTDSRAFDVFISMTSLERDMEYGSFVGDRVMNRVSEAIKSMAYMNSNETDSEDIHSTQISLH